jgi:hypothetical protein
LGFLGVPGKWRVEGEMLANESGRVGSQEDL